MMRALIIYDSQYGNTEKIARAIGNVLNGKGEVQLTRVGEAKLEQLKGTDLLFVGSPTQQFRATQTMRTFLGSIPKNGLMGVKAAAFDTRLTQAFIDQNSVLSFFERIFGYAAERIAKALKQKGCTLVTAGEGFYVEGMEGPLSAGELERAEDWARMISE
jgi:flavodoxin I